MFASNVLTRNIEPAKETLTGRCSDLKDYFILITVTRSCENFTRLTLSTAAANAAGTRNVCTLKEQVADYYALFGQSQRRYKSGKTGEKINNRYLFDETAKSKLSFFQKKCIIVPYSFSRVSGDTLVKGSFWIGLRAGG